MCIDAKLIRIENWFSEKGRFQGVKYKDLILAYEYIKMPKRISQLQFLINHLPIFQQQIYNYLVTHEPKLINGIPVDSFTTAEYTELRADWLEAISPFKMESRLAILRKNIKLLISEVLK